MARQLKSAATAARIVALKKQLAAELAAEDAAADQLLIRLARRAGLRDRFIDEARQALKRGGVAQEGAGA